MYDFKTIHRRMPSVAPLAIALLAVISFVGCGSTSNSSTPPQSSGLTITNISAGSVTSSGATITWLTDKAADSQVEYGSTTAYGQSSTLGSTLNTSHSVTLSSLSSAKTYNFRVKSRDSAGNLTTSNNFTFTTLSAPDTTPPTV